MNFKEKCIEDLELGTISRKRLPDFIHQAMLCAKVYETRARN